MAEASDRDEAGIVELFANRLRFYDAAAVRRLTGVTREQLAQAVGERRIAPLDLPGAMLFAWDDVTSLVLERWTPRQIERILVRAGRESAVPPLSRFHAITVELPLYQIRLLRQLAQARSLPGRSPLTVSDVLEDELAALAQRGVARELADFAEAAWFPAGSTRRNGEAVVHHDEVEDHRDDVEGEGSHDPIGDIGDQRIRPGGGRNGHGERGDESPHPESTHKPSLSRPGRR